jgi:hypothetical protein
MTSLASRENLLFSDRIKRRYERFWIHRELSFHTRGLCQLSYLTREDPPEKWHCCNYWQRKLSNKWNSREFVCRLGCAVPELYWSGRRVEDIPFDRLPDRYVIRPVVGHSKKGVFVIDHGLNLIDRKNYTEEQIRSVLRPIVAGFPPRRILVEELLRPERGVPSDRPMEYKIHAFGDVIGAIVANQYGPELLSSGFDERWNLLPDLYQSQKRFRPSVEPAPPECLSELVRWAKVLGTAYESYVRVDFYATERGCVFGEFAATPFRGAGFTVFGDQHLGECWDRTFPDAV